MDRGTGRWGGPVEPSARPIYGRHPLLAAGGAAVDADLPPGEAVAVGADWLDRACRLAAPLGIGPPELEVTGDHVSLVLAVPPDLRELAVVVLDQAVGATTVQELSVRPDPVLRGLYAEATAEGVPVFHDHVEVVVGFGASARRFERWALPADPVRAVAGIGRIPIVRITGTNGKTTTANLLAAIATAAGEMAGVATSEGVRVGPPSDADPRTSVTLAPSAARAARILGRDPRVTFAILETARGGLMRRGLLFDNADVAVITNVSADHLGEWGIDTVEALARAKLTVADSLKPGGTLVTTADDAVLTEMVAEWSATRPDVEVVRFSSRRNAHAWADDELIHVAGLALPIAEVPITLGGAARYNVENALAAGLAARAVGLGADAVESGLRSLRPTATDNPGRGNLYVLRGARVVIDNVSNPVGMRRIGELARALDADRVVLMFGLAAERSDAVVRGLGLAAAELGCVRYVLKPLPVGDREPGTDVALLHAALHEGGVGEERIAVAASEAEAVRIVLDGLAPGDLALLMVQHDLGAALAQLDAAGAVPG